MLARGHTLTDTSAATCSQFTSLIRILKLLILSMLAVSGAFCLRKNLGEREFEREPPEPGDPAG